MTKILPVFIAERFSFGEEGAPEHIEKQPKLPNYVGLFMVFGLVEGARSHTLAVDIETEEQAIDIAAARVVHQLNSMGPNDSMYDVGVYYPDGHIELLTSGISIENSGF